MTPREHLDQIVRPNLDEFREKFDDLRLGFNVVAALDSLIAHVYVWCLTNAPTEVVGEADDSSFRHSLAARLASEEIKLLIDIAKSQKHIQLQRGNPAVSNADQIKSDSLGWGEVPWDDGRWGSPCQVVVVTNAGINRALETILDEGLEQLENEMRRLGI